MSFNTLHFFLKYHWIQLGERKGISFTYGMSVLNFGFVYLVYSALNSSI